MCNYFETEGVAGYSYQVGSPKVERKAGGAFVCGWVHHLLEHALHLLICMHAFIWQAQMLILLSLAQLERQ